MRALLWKELREQFGRWLPATILMTGVFFLLVRARLVSIRETVILIDVIGGCILSVLLIVETFPTERTRGTMSFLYALPVPPQRIWFAKWFAAGLSIFAMLAVATLAGLITAAFVEVDLGWFVLATLCVCVSMLAFQTAAMPVLMHARHEMDAALGAAAIAVLSASWGVNTMYDDALLKVFGQLSPVAPLFNFFNWMGRYWSMPANFQEFTTKGIGLVADHRPILWSLLLTIGIWIVIPAACMWGFRRGRGRST